MPFRPLDETAAAFDRARAACETAGRDPATLVLSAAQTLAVGADESVVRRRAAAVSKDTGDLRNLAGTVDAVIDKIGAFHDLGATRLSLQVLDLGDLDHLHLVAEQVAPHV